MAIVGISWQQYEVDGYCLWFADETWRRLLNEMTVTEAWEQTKKARRRESSLFIKNRAMNCFTSCCINLLQPPLRLDGKGILGGGTLHLGGTSHFGV